MKNWKYIEGAKTGNTAHSDKVEVIKRLLHAKWSVQEIYELLKKEGYEVDKNFIERIKTGNKNQDWDVGNIDWDVGNFNGQWYVTKNGQKLVGPFMSMKEAERYLDGHKWELQDKYGNKKIGNDTPWEYAHRKPKVINDDKTGAEEFFKQLSDDVKEREDKDDADIEKVGNFKTGTSQLKPGDKVMSFGKKGTVKEVIGENTDNIYGEPLIKVEFEDGTTKTIGEHYMRKVGNARYTTREDVISHLDTDLYDICKKVPAGSPSFAYVSELQKKGWDISTISKYSKEIGKIIDQYKVGNSKTGNATPNYRYKDFLITNPEGHEYIVFLKDGRTVGYRGTTSKAQAEDWCDWHDPKTGKSIGNKTGNAKDKNGKELRVGDIVLVWTSAGERAGKVKAISGDRITVAIRNEGDWSTPGKLADKVSNTKAKNEASDDKFAYVMREFDEGKLKTPDGKVVTDPAQAKAIAYSESKKTENGLARARNAMNKKCGNSQVTLWKGNDSVLISEDGTVQYLESNSFETDRDKYDSQEQAIEELTKKGYRKK